MELPQLPPLPVSDGVEYRHVPGFYGYCAGSDGTIWSALIPNKKGRRYADHWSLKKSWKSQDGYYICSLRGDDGKEYRKLSHTITLLAFVGERPKGYDALHGNGVPNDNRIENLRWGTRKENMEDARRHGTLARREKNGHAKINTLKAKAVVELAAMGWTQRDLGLLMNVSQATISAIVNGHRWSAEDE